LVINKITSYRSTGMDRKEEQKDVELGIAR
jgi:hypothetical protein